MQLFMQKILIKTEQLNRGNCNNCTVGIGYEDFQGGILVYGNVDFGIFDNVTFFNYCPFCGKRVKIGVGIPDIL